MFIPSREISLPFALVALLATSTATLSAQTGTGQEQDPFRLPDVVVTATSTPLGRTLLSTSATIISGETLREQGIRTVADALRITAGTTIATSGGEGAQTSLFLRGGESDYTKILIDGVPANQAGGAIDLADLSTAQVERIEIVRGPASVLYGADAVSGVVQIFTRRGSGPPALSLAVSGGQGARRQGESGYGVMDLETSLSGTTGRVSYMVGGSHSTNDGLYALNNGRTLSSANGRVAWTGSGGTSLAFSARLSDGVFHYPTDGAGNPVDPNAQVDRRLLTLSATASRNVGGAVSAYLDLGYARTEQETLDEPDDSADGYSLATSESTRQIARVRLQSEIGSGTLSVGAGTEGSAGGTSYTSLHPVFDPYSASVSADRTNHSLFAEYVGAPLAEVNLTLGGRIDRNEAFGTFETFRVGFSRSVGESTRLRGMIGTAFREPTFGENFGEVEYDRGNPELLPERSRSWEVGAEQQLGPLLLGGTWFHQRFEDLIQYTSATSGPEDPNYVNVGAAEAAGFEFTASLLLGSLAVEGTFTHLDTEVLDPGLVTNAAFVEGEPLLRRPSKSGSVTGRWAFADGSLSGTLHVVGERIDVNFNTVWPEPAYRVTLEGYSTFDLAGDFALPFPDSVATRAFFRVENLLDTEYEGIYGFRGTGRVGRLGVRFGVGG